MKYETVFAAAAVLCLSVTNAPMASAADIQIAATGPVVELDVAHTINATPDVATIGAGVQTNAPTAQEALRRNSESMTKVIATLKGMGIAARDIQTSTINLNPDYEFDQQTRQQVFRGYNASNQVTVKLRKIDQVGAVLDALVGVGATNLSGPTFSLDDDTQIMAAARKDAFGEGEKQARAYAQMAGYSGVRLLEVSESVRSQGPRPMMAERAIMLTASRKAPVEAGEIGTTVNLTLKYEMTR